ncbi:hypothetical protein [Microbacterium sp.]|uniref:hypothetical protein n=1 Tax=Microbacterium sp. TaxID=51671 RepID=UPI003F9DEFFF
MATAAEIAAAKALGFIAPTGSDMISDGDDAITENAAVATRLLSRVVWRTLNSPVSDLSRLAPGPYSIRSSTIARDSGLPEPNNGVLTVFADEYQRVVEWAPTVGETALWRNAKATGAVWTGWVNIAARDLDVRLLAHGEDGAHVGAGVYGVLRNRENGSMPPGLSGSLTEWPTGDAAWTQLWQTWERNGANDLLVRSQHPAGSQVWQRPESPRAVEWARQELVALQSSLTAPRADGRAPSSSWSAAPAQIPMTVPTPDGTGQATHPSVVDVPGGWNGHRYWMAYTPYTYADDATEDPCVAWSDNGTSWTAVPNAFPLDDAPGGTDYNSDTHMVLHNGTMYVTWRQVTPTGTVFYLRTSTDGTTWTPRQTLWNSGGLSAFSPALVKTSTGWRLWIIGGALRDRKLGFLDTASADPTTGWGSVTWTYLPTPEGREPWHVDVHLHGGRWWGVLTDTEVGKFGVNCRFRLMQSDDGLTWDVAQTQLVPHLGHSHDVLYKASIVLTGGETRPDMALWYSGLAADRGWWLYKSGPLELHEPRGSREVAQADVTGLDAALSALEYDTGWRDIISYVHSPIEGRLVCRRVGAVIEIAGEGLKVSGTGTLDFMDPLGAGWRPVRPIYTPATDYWPDWTPANLRVWTNGRLRGQFGSTVDPTVTFQVVYTTTDAPPATLPGTPE